MRVQGQIKDRGEDLGGMDEPSARLIQAHTQIHTNKRHGAKSAGGGAILHMGE